MSYVQRQQMVIDHYESISGTVLYLNVWPTNRAQVADEYPFVCMAWKIELAPTNPDLILDRYFYSAWLKSGADIAPVESYWLSRDGNWPHSRCVLGHAVGP